MDRVWKNFEALDSRNLDCRFLQRFLTEIFGRNMDVESNSGNGSERNEESCRESFYYLGEYRNGLLLEI